MTDDLAASIKEDICKFCNIEILLSGSGRSLKRKAPNLLKLEASKELLKKNRSSLWGGQET